MLLPIVREMASLTERDEIARAVIGRIVIAMRGRQDHSRRLESRKMFGFRDAPLQEPSPSSPPSPIHAVPPVTVGEGEDDPAVRPSAAFTATTGAPEADHRR